MGKQNGYCGFRRAELFRKCFKLLRTQPVLCMDDQLYALYRFRSLQKLRRTGSEQRIRAHAQCAFERRKLVPLLCNGFQHAFRLCAETPGEFFHKARVFLCFPNGAHATGKPKPRTAFVIHVRRDADQPDLAAFGAMGAAAGAGVHPAAPDNADILSGKALCPFAQRDLSKLRFVHDARLGRNIALYSTVRLRFKQMQLFFIKRQIKVDRRIVLRHVEPHVDRAKQRFREAGKDMLSRMLLRVVEPRLQVKLRPHHRAHRQRPVRPVPNLPVFLARMGNNRLPDAPCIGKLAAALRVDHRCVKQNIVSIFHCLGSQHRGLT